MESRNKVLAGFCLVVAVIAGIAAGMGVLARGDGSSAEAVSIRGEHYSYATTGVYAYNAVRVVAEGVGWDAVTLFFAVPVMVVAAVFIARGSLRGRLVALGILGYFAYQYLMYAVFWALGPLFPLFVLLLPLSITGIVWILSRTDLTELAARIGDGFPRRTVVGFGIAIAVLLVAMWVPRIATGLAGDLAGAGLLGTPTLSVQALDLGLVVPLSLATALFVARRHRVGYLLAALFSVKGVTMAGAIVAMGVSAWMVEGRLEVIPFAIFAAVTLFSGWLAFQVVRSVGSAEVPLQVVSGSAVGPGLDPRGLPIA